MDFFEHQHVARKKTGRLVVLFTLAVVGIVALVYAALAAIFTVWVEGVDPTDPRFILAVAGSVAGVILLASLYKLAELRGGGRVVAESLGGRLLEPGSADAMERKVLNVVEEMAIASGVPVPPVYLLDDEQSINAFAAGYSPSDAVIGVTRGCVELLDRDELQGVMAHEFSHILHGDMRLNIRLIGVVFGILALGMIGGMILRSMAYSGHGRSRSRSGSGSGNNNGQALLIMLAVGVTLLVIGSVGVFFGNLIKAAVSRQREFLADASAVQFTRNPDGLAGALRKIGGLASGAKLVHPKAEEASHMYFGEGVSHWLGGWMSTHPPLNEPIRRIDPSWTGEFPEVAPTQRTQERHARLMQMQAERSDPAARARGMGGDAAAIAPPLIGQIGDPTPQHVAHARALLQGLDPRVRDAARETYTARALVFSLLLSQDDAVRRRQLDALEPRLAELAGQLRGAVPAEARLPVIDLALPALREMSPGQYRTFRGRVDALIDADDKVELFEWVLRRILMRHLAAQFAAVKPPVVQYYSLRGVREACATLLSTLAYVGHAEAEPAGRAFRTGAIALGLPQLPPKSPGECTMDALGEALDQLTQVAPRLKRNVVRGAATCVAADRRATVEEVELLRAVCDTLDAPMPPLLPGQALV